MNAAALLERPARRAALTWFAALAGIGAWALHLAVGYLLVPSSCASGSNLRLVLAAVLPLAIAAVTIPAGRAVARWAGDDPARARVRFLGRTGAILGVLATIAIVFGGAFPLLTEPCT